MTITLGTSGVDSVFGSSVAGGGDTIVGGSASLNFNVQNGGGDLINLASSSGNPAINAFERLIPGASRGGAVQLAVGDDTIMAVPGPPQASGPSRPPGEHIWSLSSPRSPDTRLPFAP